MQIGQLVWKTLPSHPCFGHAPLPPPSPTEPPASEIITEGVEAT